MRPNPPKGNPNPSGYSPRPITVVVQPGQEVRIVVDDGSGNVAQVIHGLRPDTSSLSPSRRPDTSSLSPQRSP